MFTVCIIGVGQLGSRHLQGARRCSTPLDIWVVDSSSESLRVAEMRYNQIESYVNHKIHYEKSMKNIPRNIDLCIIATSSKPRYKILEDLLESHKVQYLILEKFLFTSLEEYELASELIKRNAVIAYVNCPLRLYDNYAYIQSIIDRSCPIEMNVCGTDWGLCCNAIHYIDVFMQLCGENTYEVNTDMLIPHIKESKRNGYIEINGTLKFKTKCGNKLSLTSFPPDENNTSCIVSIINGGKYIEFDEIEGILKVDNTNFSFPIPYQSELTGLYIDTLIKGEKLSLSKYEESKRYHKVFLSQILAFYNKLKNENTTTLPIT